jgi:hypothetical protein
MAYCDPNTVLSPKERVRAVRVLYDRGPGPGSWSAAEVEWDNKSRLGIRWNGDDVSKVGSPQSRGNPTWFIVPDEIAVDVLKLVDTLKQRDTDELDAGYLAMANDTEREAEAMEWVEGLISDSA